MVTRGVAQTKQNRWRGGAKRGGGGVAWEFHTALRGGAGGQLKPKPGAGPGSTRREPPHGFGGILPPRLGPAALPATPALARWRRPQERVKKARKKSFQVLPEPHVMNSNTTATPRSTKCLGAENLPIGNMPDAHAPHLCTRSQCIWYLVSNPQSSSRLLAPSCSSYMIHVPHIPAAARAAGCWLLDQITAVHSRGAVDYRLDLDPDHRPAPWSYGVRPCDESRCRCRAVL
jgi:hypothetical protein